MAAERSYPGYGPRRMVMSVLGSPGSPVRCLYNLWLGAFLLYAALRFYYWADAPGVPARSALRLISLAVFAVGAGLSGGSVQRGQLQKRQNIFCQDPRNRLHGPAVPSPAGFHRSLHPGQGRPCLDMPGGLPAGAPVLHLFILADKPSLGSTPLAWEGLWQLLALACMYVPLACRAGGGLLGGL